MTGDCESAARAHGFGLWAGTIAKQGPHAHPGGIGDALLHETAISWLRRVLEKTTPRKPWDETPEDLEQRLQDAARHINENFQVRELCKEFPLRLAKLAKETKGDRLKS